MMIQNINEVRIVRMEGILRFLGCFFAAADAVLLKINKETEEVIPSIKQTADVTVLQALGVIVAVAFIASGYHFLRLFTDCISRRFKAINTNLTSCKNKMAVAWISFSLDQAMTYAIFAANSAATQASFMALVGQTQFEWMKLCNIYTRFCKQVGTALFFGYTASVCMALVTCLSAFHLFRQYHRK